MMNCYPTIFRSGIILTVIVFFGGHGCNRDVRLAGKKMHSVEVQTVNLYGSQLDEQATPEQVAFVALLAIREDFLAQSDRDRDVALQKQFEVSAANVIQSRNRTMLSRDEFLYHVVYRWTPTVSHYVYDFDTEWETARLRLVRRDLPAEQWNDPNVPECMVMMEVDDPGGDPRARVVLVIWLAKDSGLWRVVHLGFDSRHRSIEQRVSR